MDATTRTDSPVKSLLANLFNMPIKAESFLDQLTPDQIHAIEDTINRVKRRKTDTTADVKIENCREPSYATNVASALMSAMTPASSDNSSTGGSNSASNTASSPSSDSQSDTHMQEASAPATPEYKDASTAHEPVAEMRDGVEWVSFVYSHNRTLKRYTIRTDLHTVSLDTIDSKFKNDNCVYPRANLPKEEYKGNRWAYETECNVLGWKLAWLNASEISGKRGLIQRAVDSYRNRYPSMRSRRVARQEKLKKGTLRKRKNREGQASEESAQDRAQGLTCNLAAEIVRPASHPKTIAMEEGGSRFRIKINVECVNLEVIPADFRRTNCVFPRAMGDNQYASGHARWTEESLCNELGWKLAWLNQRHLAGKKNLLQRALDLYRTKFMPSLPPRKRRQPTPAVPPQVIAQANRNVIAVPLTASALSAQNAWYEQMGNPVKKVSTESCTSGTTVTLDFADCFSLTAQENDEDNEEEDVNVTEDDDESTDFAAITIPADEGMMVSPPYSPTLALCDRSSCDESSTTNSSACTPSPPATSAFFDISDTDFLYDSFMLPPTNDMFSTFDTADTKTTRLYDPVLTSPSLPSSAVQQDDLVVKMEDENLLLPSDFVSEDAVHLMSPLF